MTARVVSNDDNTAPAESMTAFGANTCFTQRRPSARLQDLVLYTIKHHNISPTVSESILITLDYSVSWASLV